MQNSRLKITNTGTSNQAPRTKTTQVHKQKTKLKEQPKKR